MNGKLAAAVRAAGCPAPPDPKVIDPAHYAEVTRRRQRTVRKLALACHDASCAPPPAGSGGSSGGGKGAGKRAGKLKKIKIKGYKRLSDKKLTRVMRPPGPRTIRHDRPHDHKMPKVLERAIRRVPDWKTAVGVPFSADFACHDASCAPPPAGTGGSSGGSGSVTSSRPGWSPVEQHGMSYDPKNASNPAVVAGRALPDEVWDAVPTTSIKLGPGGPTLHANESHLKDKTLAKVHEPGFEFREGYANRIVIDQHGDYHIVDGHHRVGMHIEAGHDSLPAKVIDLRQAPHLRSRWAADRPVDKLADLMPKPAAFRPSKVRIPRSDPRHPEHSDWQAQRKAGAIRKLRKATAISYANSLRRASRSATA